MGLIPKLVDSTTGMFNLVGADIHVRSQFGVRSA